MKLNKPLKSILTVLVIWALIVVGLTTAMGQNYTIVPRTIKTQRDTCYPIFSETVIMDTIWNKDTLWRGVYVNSYNNIVGIKTKEDALIKDLNKFKFNSIHLYGVSSINGTSKDASMRLLNTRIRRETKVTDINATVGRASSAIGARTTYNKNSTDSADFDSWNLEQESWNASANYDSAWAVNKADLAAMANGKTAGGVDYFVQYIGWPDKTLKMKTEFTKELVSKTEYGIFHDYKVTPSFGYIEARCDLANAEAKSAKKIWRIRPIFSAEPNFSAGLLKSGMTLDQIFFLVYSGFKAKNYSNLIMDGYLWFHLDFIRANQPATAGARRQAPVLSDPNFKNETTKNHLKLIEP